MTSKTAHNTSETSKNAYREVRIDRPDEDDNTPTMLQAFNHPIRAKCPRLPPGRTLIFLLPTSDEGREDRSNEEAKMALPGKNEDTLIDAGFLKLSVGDLLLGRSSEVTTEPVYRDDGNLGWVDGGGHFMPSRLRDRLQQATDNAIGDLANQDGRAYFETLPGVVPVKNTARCYTYGPVVQAPKNIIQPSATLAMDQDNDDATEFQDIVNNVLSAVMPCAVDGFERGPPSVRDAVRGQAEVLGIPRIGCSTNYAWPTAQMNISAAQKHDEDLDLEEELGSRGHVHYDSGDHRGLLSALVSNPQLPEGYHPGVFALLYLKVFITLDPFITFFFSGRQAHVGTAPSAPPGEDPSPEALRCIYICYPNGRMLDGMGIYQFVSDPRGAEPISIPPEIVNYGDADEDVVHTSRATWLHEGARLMEPKSLADFIGHKVLQMAHYYVSRTPEECGIEIDGESLVKAFRVRGARGQTPYRPSRKGQDLAKREQARQRFKTFVNKHDRFYPSILKTGPRKKSGKKSHKQGSEPPQYSLDLSAAGDGVALPTRQPAEAYPAVQDEETPTISTQNASPPQSPGSASTQPHQARRPRSSLSTEEDLTRPSPAAAEPTERSRSRRSSSGSARVLPANGVTRNHSKMSLNSNGKSPTALATSPHLSSSDDLVPSPAASANRGRSLAYSSPTAAPHSSTSNSIAPSRPTASFETSLMKEVQAAPGSRSQGQADSLSRPSSLPPMGRIIEPFAHPNGLPQSTIEHMNEDIEMGDGTSSLGTHSFTAAPWVEQPGNPKRQAIPQFAPEDQPSAKRRRVEERLYPALRNLQTRSIYAESRSVYREVHSATGDMSREVALEVDSKTRTLEDLCARLDLASGHEAPQLAVQLLPLLSHGEVVVGASALELRRCRSRIMQASRAIVQWLDRVHAQTWSCLKGGRNEPEWLVCLVRELKDMLFYQRPQIHFNPSQPDHRSLTVFTTAQFSYHNASRSDRRWPDNDDRTFHQVSMAIQEIVRKQLYHDDLDEKEGKGRMVEALEKSFGEEVLLLDTVWRDYQDFNLKDYLLPQDRKRRTNVCILARKLEAAASSHPIRDPSQDVGRAYGLFRSVLRGNLPGGPNTLGLYEPEFADLGVLLDAGLAYVTGRHEEDLGLDGRRMLGEIRSGVNYALPFRQRAGEVVRMQVEVFQRPIIRTAPGLFSAILWRGITFDTPFSRRAPPSFTTFEAFEDAKHHQETQYPEETKKKSYFCDINAYGGSAFGRKIDNALGYWDSAAELEGAWSKLIGTTPSFMDCLHFFRPPGQETSRFPQLGPLGSYLLTCDLSYAGVCGAPSSLDIATCIYEMDKGGMEGLAYLGLASLDRKGNRERHISEVEHGIQVVSEFIQRNYSKREQEEMVLDFICIEHVLCKLVRHQEILRGA